ncbi:hypothetical protein SLNWT_0671 [Streptomyces albus]|uniref:Uncharacterized protein n=1 Tax=Streptomyces albus (strain ATCC 21838 / DSM 41398 / FERM P-419 / JCM 4703 / NBRC 107858) TaxID=1081613 RepID=A0A0B5ESE1_STRA4|nr:hypothetical protein SLNWT_0671 [Streptomyces albus]AOU75359.1 hypothetical protein SLNHY_0668 [Streptomyces albus]
MPSPSRTAPTAPGTHARRTGQRPEQLRYENLCPAHREHAPDTADTTQDGDDTP